MDEIRKVVNEDIQNYDYSLDFLDVTQTGRKTWIEVYVKSKNDVVKIKDFKRIQEHITKDLENKFDQISVEIVPAIQHCCKKLSKGKSVNQIADELEEDVSKIKEIYDVAKDFAPEYDVKKILEKLG